jgi:hypothetical protein
LQANGTERLSCEGDKKKYFGGFPKMSCLSKAPLTKITNRREPKEH